jgi:hypothetical protein
MAYNVFLRTGLIVGEAHRPAEAITNPLDHSLSLLEGGVH